MINKITDLIIGVSVFVSFGVLLSAPGTYILSHATVMGTKIAGTFAIIMAGITAYAIQQHIMGEK